METRTVGSSDLVVSLAGLGCNNFGSRVDDSRAHEIVYAALDLGITMFDTARIYGDGRSEAVLGAALGARRDEVVIGTKFGADRRGDGNASPARIMAEVEASLEALGTDWIDLYQMHFPDSTTPIDETLTALTDLVQQGKVRAIGCSNISAAAVTEAVRVAEAGGLASFVSVQNEWSVLARTAEEEMLGTCAQLGLGMFPYFPLASGVLTGKVAVGAAPPEGSRLNLAGFDRYLADEHLAAVERLAEWSRARGRTVHDVALSYLASEAVTASVIAGASSAEQVRQNAAATRRDLSSEERAEIRAVVNGARPGDA